MHTQIHEKSLRNCKGCLPAHPKFTRTIVIAVHTRHCCANQKGSSEKQSRGSKASSSCRTTENSARKSKQHIFLPNTRAKRGSYRHIRPHVLPAHGRPSPLPFIDQDACGPQEAVLEAYALFSRKVNLPEKTSQKTQEMSKEKKSGNFTRRLDIKEHVKKVVRNHRNL